MKLWGFRKHGDESDGHQIEEMESKRPSESEYQCLWIPLCAPLLQVLPRIDSNLCVNEHGEVALIALPDLAFSMALGKVKYDHPKSVVVLIRQIQQGRDKSYLAPVTLTDEQALKLGHLTSVVNTKRGEFFQELKKHDWQKIVSEVKANNFTFLTDSSYRQELNRIRILDNTSPKDWDDVTILPGFGKTIPVFLYTMPNTNVEMSRDHLQRQVCVRQWLLGNQIDAVKNIVRALPGWERSDRVTIEVIGRLVAELMLGLRTPQPSFADVMLNPKNAELIPGPIPTLNPNSEGVKALERLLKSTTKLRLNITNWGGPDVAQVTLHVIQSENQPLKDSVTSPAITIFKDEMGIHTLPAQLFRIRTTSLSLPAGARQALFLDDIPASQLPEISWEPLSEGATSEWWQTDPIVKKVLWLVTQNLASHLVGNPEEVICSITPVGNDVIQVTLLFDVPEAGAPYAFAIIRDFAIGLAPVEGSSIALTIVAIPIFQAGFFESKPGGSLMPRKGFSLKNYAITREGVRLESTQSCLLFNQSVYPAVISGKYKDPPRLYRIATKNPQDS